MTTNQAETDTTTQRSAHIIHLFAFFVLSSSPQETRYITQAIIRAITAKTATYFIISPIIFAITPTALLFEVLTLAISIQPQPGSPAQLISGAPPELLEDEENILGKEIASTDKKEKQEKIRRTIRNILRIIGINGKVSIKQGLLCNKQKEL